MSVWRLQTYNDNSRTDLLIWTKLCTVIPRVMSYLCPVTKHFVLVMERLLNKDQIKIRFTTKFDLKRSTGSNVTEARKLCYCNGCQYYTRAKWECYHSCLIRSCANGFNCSLFFATLRNACLQVAGFIHIVYLVLLWLAFI